MLPATSGTHTCISIDALIVMPLTEIQSRRRLIEIRDIAKTHHTGTVRDHAVDIRSLRDSGFALHRLNLANRGFHRDFQVMTRGSPTAVGKILKKESEEV